jgi:hypothetical protein
MGSVDAERMNPLARMTRPRGASPHHSVALVLAPTAIRASEPLPLVHTIFVDALDADRLGGENSYRIASSFRLRPAGRRIGRPGHQREDDAGDLVGERHRGQIELVFDRLALEHPARPQAHGVAMASAMAQRRAGAHHQKLAQVAVAHLCDAPEPRFAAGRDGHSVYAIAL